MIDALISGRLYGRAEERSGQSGSLYVTCKVRAMTDDGDTLMCNVIAFNDQIRSLLLSLDDGESISLSGAFGGACNDKRIIRAGHCARVA